MGGAGGYSFLATLTEHDLFGAYVREELADTYRQSLLDQRVVNPVGLSALDEQTRILEDT